MTQLSIDWSPDLARPVAPSVHPLARHASATGAQYARDVLGDLARQYLALLERLGQATDEQMAEALGVKVSSINSTRNGLARLVTDSGEAQPVRWIRGGRVRHTERTYWRLRTPEEIRRYDEEHA